MVSTVLLILVLTPFIIVAALMAIEPLIGNLSPEERSKMGVSLR